MNANDKISDEDSALFRQSVNDPKKIKQGYAEHKAHADIAMRQRQKLKRHALRYEDKLDLHNLYELEARKRLAAFIRGACAENLQSVLIVHGKGLHSETPGGVLKPMVREFLKSCDAVRAFYPAQPKDGGDGATYALLKKTRR